MAAVFFLCTALLAGSSAQETEQLALKNAEFATALYRKVAGSTDDNVVISPLSVSLGLAALAGGAAGQTRSQILETLRLSALDEPGQLLQNLREALENDAALRFDQGAAVFAGQQVQVEAAFKDQARMYYNAEVQNTNFAAVQAAKNQINDFSRTVSGDKIRDVNVPVDSQTQMLLVSASFFKGQWLLPFNASVTQDERFYIDKYHIVQVPMMFNSDKYYLAYDPALKVGILKLPCAGGAAMLVLLPDEDVDYTSIDDDLYAAKFMDWLKKLKKTKLEVQLPRFSLEQSYSLKMSLATMGITDVFQGNADLSGLSKEQDLKLSEVVHKAAIEADESGSVAAATPGGDQNVSNLPPRLTINRPFLFLVYHEATKNLLLMGRVNDPTKK
ncbi:serpin peptidase inhibitor, clade A (alpha-1 antiproteinase, antitrypsin), member 10a [Denticeps clupeoides]|nr:protein Z-dependent protease inhibitor-like [Denticeps clupeoides]